MEVPDFLKSVVKHSSEGFCEMTNDPSLWSESIIEKTMKRAGSQAFDIEDAQLLIKNYLSVLCDTIKQKSRM
ncbi:MAG: hypothetical protein V1736_04020 [Pseudomonadota bacterium]